MPEVAGLLNCRDVGGLPTADGRLTRAGVLYRSEALTNLTDEGARVLAEELGLRAVVDLRTAGESISEGRGPLSRHHVAHINVPLRLAPLGLVSDPSLRTGELTARVYNSMIDDEDGLLPLAITLLAAALPDPCIVHCAAGKDRTGMFIALVLDLVGVRRDAIVEDYLRSADMIDAINDRLAASAKYKAHMERVPWEFYEVHEHALARCFEHVDTAYGGTRAWARFKGLPESSLDRLALALVG